MRAFDLEEGASSASAGSGERNEAEFVGTSLSPAKKEQWCRVIGTMPYGPAGHYNPHGLLAAQRYVAEKFACDVLKTNGVVIVDVGAAPHRTYAHLGEKAWYMMPSIHPGDNSRVGRAPHGARDLICRHRFEECQCVSGQKRAYLMTHSAYYLDPQVLWETLFDEDVVDALVIEHTFDDVYGGFYDEASWSLERDTVTMRVTGNGHPYVHTLPPWQCGWIGNNGESFQIDVLKVLDKTTRVVRVEPIRTMRVQNGGMTWKEVEANPDMTGPVQFSNAVKMAVMDNAKFTGVNFDLHKLRKFGPVLYTDYVIRGENVSVTVPVNGVSQVATLCCNRPRDAALYAEVTHVMRNRYARGRMPPSKAALVLATVVALGFVVNLENETDITYTMLSKFSWAMKVHSVLLQFGNVTVRRWPWFLCFGLVLLAGLAPVEALDKNPIQRVIAAVSVVVFFLLCVCLMRVAVVVSRVWHEYKTKTWVDSLSSCDSPTVPLLGQCHPLRRNFPIPGSRYIRPIPSVLHGEMTLGASREKAQEPERSLVSGVIADGAMPTVLATTQEAEASAVGNRILAPRDNPEPDALASYRLAFSSEVFKLVGKGIDMSQTAFRVWLKKIAEVYPAVYVQRMEEVWRTHQGTVADPAATKSFLKVEKSAATVKDDGAKATKPRLIQPPEDIDKAMTGYVVTQLYNLVRSAWDGIKTPVLYVSGRSLRYVGERVDDFLGKHPDAEAWSVDMASYDSTLGWDLQTGAFEFYESLGVPRWWTSWLVRIRTRGVTPNGVHYIPFRYYSFESKKDAESAALFWRKRKFKVKGPIPVDAGWGIRVEDFQMTSGRMDTNLTDTVCLVASFERLFKAKVEYLLLVCGDDAFLLLPPGMGELVNEIMGLQKRLGLKPEGKLSARRSDWEFCSKLFWFARETENGPDITVLGSKPFRGIARMGSNTTLPGAMNAASAALSVRIDAGHVPFLGAFADRTYELCREKKVKPTGKPEWAAMRGDKRYLPSPLNYVLTQERYNLGRENEEQFRRLLADLNGVPIVFEYPPLKDAICRDEE